MRVSLPICIVSSVVVVLLTWWLSTRSRDFLTAPPESELERTRLAATQQNPTAQGGGDALSPSTSSQDQAPIPVILPEHVQDAPKLDDYLEEAKLGADYLIELAELLEKDHPLRSLTCWERVLDSTKASSSQIQRAAKQVARLKTSTPLWNADPEKGLTVVIQAGTGPTTAALLKPPLDQIAMKLQKISSGVLTVEFKISAGEEDLVDEGEAPVAIWISGPSADSPSTEVLSFSHPVDSSDGLDETLDRILYNMIRHHLSQMDNFQPLPKLEGQNSPDKLLEGRISRMVWNEFGRSLQTSP